jgi:hypothetical protein
MRNPGKKSMKLKVKTTASILQDESQETQTQKTQKKNNSTAVYVCT